MKPGLYTGVPMKEYLEIDALGSGRIEHLGISPLHYKYMLGQPSVDTPSTRLGTAVHMALLEPEVFAKVYWPEPDPALIAPDNKVPRATKVYKDAVAAMAANGITVLKQEVWDQVGGMVGAVRAHPHAARILSRADEREVTAVWDREGRLCRGRVDMLGGGVLADVKTTRSLRDFSPWTITRRGYHRQTGWYVDGLRRLGREMEHVFLVAVESSPPYDVGVFSLDKGLLQVGLDECRGLVSKLEECERTGIYPGQFPEIVDAQLTDAAALDLAGVSVED